MSLPRDGGQMYPGTVGIYAGDLRVGTVVTRRLQGSPEWAEDWLAHDWARLRASGGPLVARWRELGQDGDRPDQVQLRSHQEYDYLAPPTAEQIQQIAEQDDPWGMVESFSVSDLVDGQATVRGWLFRRYAHRAEGAETGVDHWVLSAGYQPPDQRVSLLLEPLPGEGFPDAQSFLMAMERRWAGASGWRYVRLPYAFHAPG